MEQVKSLRLQRGLEVAEACHIAARSVEAGDKALRNRIGAAREDNGDCRGRRLSRLGGNNATSRKNHRDLSANQIGSQAWKLIVSIHCPAIFNVHILTFDIASFAQALTEGSK